MSTKCYRWSDQSYWGEYPSESQSATVRDVVGVPMIRAYYRAEVATCRPRRRQALPPSYVQVAVVQRYFYHTRRHVCRCGSFD